MRQFGCAEIERASEIVFDRVQQAWCIKVTRGKYTGQHINVAQHQTALAHAEHGKAPRSWPALEKVLSEVTAFFSDYDEAVAAEIMTLDYVRLTEGPDVL